MTLYPGNEGYTLALKIQNALEKQTVRIPYEEDELLKCIDNQQLPPGLVELLEETGAQVFYDGCVFVEVKDYRENTKHSWNVLLKPTPQVDITISVFHICFLKLTLLSLLRAFLLMHNRYATSKVGVQRNYFRWKAYYARQWLSPCVSVQTHY